MQTAQFLVRRRPKLQLLCRQRSTIIPLYIMVNWSLPRFILENNHMIFALDKDLMYHTKG